MGRRGVMGREGVREEKRKGKREKVSEREKRKGGEKRKGVRPGQEPFSRRKEREKVSGTFFTNARGRPEAQIGSHHQARIEGTGNGVAEARRRHDAFSIFKPRFSAYADSDKCRGPRFLAWRSSRSRS
jgi:hypothetical protein